ncbi:hypothetical protein HU200_043588 [Digitaria exilis]|uniref:Myb-like domain-containing protein n=1 Tax=Digitaria exilis TaxID=1010633 RepID=A0A835B3V4_9POAL|nr:hypothetical protein HU200_043588 [Digitaria exilis]
MPHDGSSSAAAAAPPLAASWGASPSPEQKPTWSRRDDKFLELLLFARNAAINAHDASNVLGGKTPAQMQERCSFIFEEIRSVLEALYVETPREWDDTEITAAAATPKSAAEEEEEAPGAVVVAAQQVAAAAEDSAAATDAGGGGCGNRQTRKKTKKPVQWTHEEHKYAHRLLLASLPIHGSIRHRVGLVCRNRDETDDNLLNRISFFSNSIELFIAGLDLYRGNWNLMSREYLTNKTASQIASHHQKYRKREKQRESNRCKRASIHDITEPGIAAIAAAAAAAAARGVVAAAWKDDASARGQDDEERKPAESGEDGIGPIEEFPWRR